MAFAALAIGAMLVVVGVYGYGFADPGKDGMVSPTALIPAAVGGVLMLCGLLAFSAKLRKHVMHLAAVVGLVGFAGGFMPLVRQYNKTGEFDPAKPSALSGEAMIVLCGVFVALCVNSFIQARVLRKSREPIGAAAPNG